MFSLILFIFFCFLLSSTSFIFFWFFMSVLTLFFLAKMKISSESILFYFLQEMCLLGLFYFWFAGAVNQMLLFLFMKMGAPPFHFWVTQMVKSLSQWSFLFFITSLKIAPLLLILYFSPLPLLLALVFLMSNYLIFFSEKVKMILFFSSSSSVVLILLISLQNKTKFLLFLLSYFLGFLKHQLFGAAKKGNESGSPYSFMILLNFPFFVLFLFKYSFILYFSPSLLLVFLLLFSLFSSFAYLKSLLFFLEAKGSVLWYFILFFILLWALFFLS